jgi:hypothetical protein
MTMRIRSKRVLPSADDGDETRDGATLRRFPCAISRRQVQPMIIGLRMFTRSVSASDAKPCSPANGRVNEFVPVARSLPFGGVALRLRPLRPATGAEPPGSKRVRIHEKEWSMRRIRTRFGRPVRPLMVLAVMMFFAGGASAQGEAARIPDHAHATKYGGGWECDNGYREAKGGCAAIKVPANAYPTNAPYGRGWECRRGYRERNESCIAVKVPAHAYLTAEGDGWRCERGYREAHDTCIAVKAPAHGYLSSDLSSRTGWKCDRGYRPAGQACKAVKVPEHGFLSNSEYDLGWKCNRGYRPVRETCVAVSVPENAFLTESEYGRGWKCERGYQEGDNACVVLKLPENSHLDYSGNSWECDKPYRKRQDGCALI